MIPADIRGNRIQKTDEVIPELLQKKVLEHHLPTKLLQICTETAQTTSPIGIERSPMSKVARGDSLKLFPHTGNAEKGRIKAGHGSTTFTSKAGVKNLKARKFICEALEGIHLEPTLQRE